MVAGLGWHYVRLRCLWLLRFYHDPPPTGLLEITICRSPLHAEQLSGVPFLKAAATQRSYKLSLDQWLPHHLGMLTPCYPARRMCRPSL
jgi:hypothetical protein